MAAAGQTSAAARTHPSTRRASDQRPPNPPVLAWPTPVAPEADAGTAKPSRLCWYFPLSLGSGAARASVVNATYAHLSHGTGTWCTSHPVPCEDDVPSPLVHDCTAATIERAKDRLPKADNCRLENWTLPPDEPMPLGLLTLASWQAYRPASPSPGSASAARFAAAASPPRSPPARVRRRGRRSQSLTHLLAPSPAWTMR